MPNAQETRPPEFAPPSFVREGHVEPAPSDLFAQFYRRLADLEAGRIRRLTILQVGDSHTEGDYFSGHLRALFQARFGNAGRGMLPPGSPIADWHPMQVHVGQSGKWQIFSSNKTDHAMLPYGLSGFVLRGADAGDAIWLEATDEGNTFDTVVVEYYRNPVGGRMSVTVDAKSVGEIQTHGDSYHIARQAFSLPLPGWRLEVKPHGDGAVDIADWAVYRNATGVVLTSHGFSGAQVSIMDAWDQGTITSQLTQLDPALILLAFGTNEGYAPKTRLQNYQHRLEARIEALQRAAPNASLVLVGGPDANRIPKYCNGTSAQHDQIPCRPLSQEEVSNYDVLLSHSDRGLCRWHTPGSYDFVRDVQRKVARSTGAYFWDWFEFEGGSCGAYRWEREGLVHKDRVHMKREGYSRSADQLFSVLMRGYTGTGR
jgi:lysophospholipase L1-like esterase